MTGLFRVQRPEQLVSGLNQGILGQVILNCASEAAQDLDSGPMLVGIRQGIEGIEELPNGCCHRLAPK
jgi:hypothetical protein